MYQDLEAELHDVFWQIDEWGQREIDSIAQAIASKPGRVLELGCGSGRVMIPLLQRGISVDGLELSNSMIELCKMRLSDEELASEIYHADMAGFHLPDQRYDWIIVPAFSLQMLDGKEGLESCLRAMRGHLTEGGRVYLSVFLPWAELLGDLEAGEWYDDAQAENAETGELACLQTRFELDAAQQCLRRQHHYQVFGSNRELLREQRTAMTLHFYLPDQLRAILRKSGYRILEMWADFEPSEPVESADYPACLSFVLEYETH